MFENNEKCIVSNEEVFINHRLVLICNAPAGCPYANSEVFRVTFFTFCTSFLAFRISQNFAPGLAFARKVKGFRGLFFRGINKTRNLHEIQKVYSECFVFCGVLRKHSRREIPAKCKIQKVYRRPRKSVQMTTFARMSNQNLSLSLVEAPWQYFSHSTLMIQ